MKCILPVSVFGSMLHHGHLTGIRLKSFVIFTVGFLFFLIDVVTNGIVSLNILSTSIVCIDIRFYHLKFKHLTSNMQLILFQFSVIKLDNYTITIFLKVSHFLKVISKERK